MTTTDQSEAKAQPPWHAAFPAPRTTDPKSITPTGLLQRLQAGQRGGREFLLVDLRRNDHEVSSVVRFPFEVVEYPYFGRLSCYSPGLCTFGSQTPGCQTRLTVTIPQSALDTYHYPSHHHPEKLTVLVVKGGTIHSSINIPAQTLYPSLEALYSLVTAAKIPLVIFYCGSSQGRGTRAAGWLADLIEDKSQSKSAADDVVVESVILQGGIKGWVRGGEEYRKWMDGFEESVWKGSL